MQKNKILYIVLNYAIALVWLVNGIFCKVLNKVPRHEEIIGSILGAEHACYFTLAIGFSEVAMAFWVLSQYKPRLNTITQIVIVALMNIIEFMAVPDLLLWGKLNALFAFLFILVVSFNEFYLRKNITQKT